MVAGILAATLISAKELARISVGNDSAFMSEMQAPRGPYVSSVTKINARTDHDAPCNCINASPVSDMAAMVADKNVTFRTPAKIRRSPITSPTSGATLAIMLLSAGDTHLF